MKQTIGYIDGQGNHSEMPLETFKREYCTVLGLKEDFKEADEIAIQAITKNPSLVSRIGQALFKYARNRDSCFVIDILQQKMKSENLTLSLLGSFDENNSLMKESHYQYEQLKDLSDGELADMMKDCKARALEAIEVLKS